MSSNDGGKSLSHRDLDLDALVTRAQRGDLNAEKLLFERLTARFRIILHHKVRNHDEVEDIMQEALTVIAQEYKSLEVESSFAGWAVGVLQNRLLMHFRSRKSYAKRFADAESVDSWYAAQDVGSDLKQTLIECVRKICTANTRYARILILSFQGFRVDEICQRLDITRTNAYSLLSRSRSLLELCLETGSIA